MRKKNKKLRSRWRVSNCGDTRCYGRGHDWIYKFYAWFGYSVADCRNCSAEAYPLSYLKYLESRRK